MMKYGHACVGQSACNTIDFITSCSIGLHVTVLHWCTAWE